MLSQSRVGPAAPPGNAALNGVSRFPFLSRALRFSEDRFRCGAVNIQAQSGCFGTRRKNLRPCTRRDFPAPSRERTDTSPARSEVFEFRTRDKTRPLQNALSIR